MCMALSTMTGFIIIAAHCWSVSTCFRASSSSLERIACGSGCCCCGSGCCGGGRWYGRWCGRWCGRCRSPPSGGSLSSLSSSSSLPLPPGAAPPPPPPPYRRCFLMKGSPPCCWAMLLSVCVIPPQCMAQHRTARHRRKRSKGYRNSTDVRQGGRREMKEGWNHDREQP